MARRQTKDRRRKMKTKKRVSKAAAPSSSVETFIEARFDRLENKLDDFKDEINAWKQEFVKQLTKLNTNMESVLNTIAEHEGRITKLEQSALKSETRRETVSELSKFGWTAAKLLLGVGAVIGAVGGCGWVLKLISI